MIQFFGKMQLRVRGKVVGVLKEKVWCYTDKLHRVSTFCFLYPLSSIFSKLLFQVNSASIYRKITTNIFSFLKTKIIFILIKVLKAYTSQYSHNYLKGRSTQPLCCTGPLLTDTLFSAGPTLSLISPIVYLVRVRNETGDIHPLRLAARIIAWTW